MARPGRRLGPVSVGVIGLALIGLGQGGPNRQAIQDDLTDRSTAALQSAGLTGLSVSFSGRDATITGPGAAEHAEQAEAVVAAVAGVRVADSDLDAGPAQPGVTMTATRAPVQSQSPAPSPTQGQAPAETPSTAPETTTAQPTVPVGFTLADGAITVTGTVGSTSAGTALMAAVTAVGSDWQVVDRLLVDDALTTAEPTPDRLSAVTDLLKQAPVGGEKLVIQYNRGSVILRGAPADAEAERRLLDAAAATVAGPTAVIDGLDTPAG